MIKDLSRIIDKRIRKNKKNLQVRKVIKKASKTKNIIILSNISF